MNSSYATQTGKSQALIRLFLRRGVIFGASPAQLHSYSLKLLARDVVSVKGDFGVKGGLGSKIYLWETSCAFTSELLAEKKVLSRMMPNFRGVNCCWLC